MKDYTEKLDKVSCDLFKVYETLEDVLGKSQVAEKLRQLIIYGLDNIINEMRFERDQEKKNQEKKK